jgi:hypothetical protein
VTEVYVIKQAVLLLSIAASLQAAVVLGQVDDFEDGSTMGWHVPDLTHPFPPENIATDGPAGSDDNYLRLTALGAGMAGSRMSVLSGSQWGGDYVLTGVSHIVMHVRNFGPDDLNLRLLLEDFGPMPGPPLNLAVTSQAVEVPAGSEWMRVVFAITPDALQVVGPAGSVEAALASVDILRLFHNPDPDHPGPFVGPPPVNAVLGVDNITAAAIPEPAAYWLASGAILVLFAKRLRTRV